MLSALLVVALRHLDPLVEFKVMAEGDEVVESYLYVA
jgi:hypothetical protein